jgi:hypothetical protein
MREIIVSMPKSMAEWFEQCMEGAGQKCSTLPFQHPLSQVILYRVQAMTIEEVHLLLKTRVQVSVNAHEIQASL